VLLLGAYRDVEVTHRHSLKGVLRDLGRERLLERIAIHRLLPEGTLALIGAVLGTNQVSEEFATLIHDRTEGNPFFTGELLRDLIERGAVYRDASGHWEQHEIEQITIPEGVRAVMGQRIGHLASQTQDLLTEAAVLGQVFTFDELAGMVGRAEEELERALEEATVAGLIREERGQDRMGGAYAFAHVLIQQTLYTELTARRRRRLHLAAGEVMERLPEQARAARSAEMAWHFEAAGDVRAVSYLVNAAERAATLFAYDHAADLYTRALTAQESYLEDNPIERFQLLLAREALYDRQGRRAEQAEDVTALVTLAEALGDPTRLAVAYKRQAGYLTYTHRYNEAQRLGEQTLALYRERGDRLGEAQTLRELGFLHWSAGDYGQALVYGRLALQLHRVLGDVSAEATALHNLAEIYRGLGSPRQALQLYSQALDLHWASKDQQWQGLTLYGMAHALRQVGNTQAALERYQQALTASAAVGDRLMVSRVHQVLASILWDSSPADHVLTHLHQALSISQEIGYGPGIAHGLSALGIFAAQKGDQMLARRYFEEAGIWLRRTEDRDGLSDIQNRLLDLTHEPPPMSSEPPVMGWVKSHLALAEGKVYCEFESPLARSQR
jgi:predicted ATPase